MPKDDMRPDSPIATREELQDPYHNWRGIPGFLPQLEMRPDSPTVTQEQSRVTPLNLKGLLTPFW